jgi:hypothetical protein
MGSSHGDGRREVLSMFADVSEELIVYSEHALFKVSLANLDNSHYLSGVGIFVDVTDSSFASGFRIFPSDGSRKCSTEVRLVVNVMGIWRMH